MKEKVFKFVKYLEMLLIILCLASFKPAKLNVNSISEFSNEEVITFSSFKYSKFLDFSLSIIDIKNEENFKLTFYVQKLNDVGTFYVFGSAQNETSTIKSEITTISSYTSSSVINEITIVFPWDAIDKKTKITLYSSRSSSSTVLSDSVYFYVTSPFEAICDYNSIFYYAVDFKDNKMMMKKENLNFGDFLETVALDYYIRIKVSDYKIYFNCASASPISNSGVFLFFKDPLNRYLNVFPLSDDGLYRYIQFRTNYLVDENAINLSYFFTYYVNVYSLSMSKFKFGANLGNSYVNAKNYFYLPMYNFADYSTLECYIKINNFGTLKKNCIFPFKFTFANEYALDSFYISSNQGKRNWGEKMETIIIWLEH